MTDDRARNSCGLKIKSNHLNWNLYILVPYEHIFKYLVKYSLIGTVILPYLGYAENNTGGYY